MANTDGRTARIFAHVTGTASCAGRSSMPWTDRSFATATTSRPVYYTMKEILRKRLRCTGCSAIHVEEAPRAHLKTE
jgi:hypothetical protein